MTLCFSISGTSEEEDSLASRGQLGQLVKGVDGSFCGEDSAPCSVGEPESSNSEALGDVEESGIVGDSADDSDDSGVVFGFSFGDGSAVLGEVLGDSGDGDGISV